MADGDLLAQLDETPVANAASARNPLVWIPVFLALFALLGLLAWGLIRDQQAGASSFSTNDGPAAVAVLSRPASEFSGALYDPFNGLSEFSLSDYQGKVVVVNFWASWCPHGRKI